MHTVPLIYALVDPRSDVIGYVGQSVNGVARAKAHFRPSNRKITAHLPSTVWVESLLNAGVTPKIKILEEVACVSALSLAERKWISRGRNKGWPLTNLTAGGRGIKSFKHTAAAKKAMSIARSGKKFSERHRLAISEALKGKKFSLRRRMRMAKANLGKKHSEATKKAMVVSQAHRRWVEQQLRIAGST